MLSKLVFLIFTVTLNIYHLYIPARVLNFAFEPFISILAFLTFLIIVFFISSLKTDWIFISTLGISLASQIYSFYSNGGGVPDYINLYFFDSNIPDFFISLTILTWWYYRVYKQSNLIPAKLEQDVN